MMVDRVIGWVVEHVVPWVLLFWLGVIILITAAIPVVLLLIAIPAQAADSRGTWEDDCQCWRNAAYGTATWPPRYKQDLDYWPVTRDASNTPLVIFAHPSGSNGPGSKRIGVGTAMFDKIIAPARAAGYAVASLEYRHPVSDSDIVIPTVHDDIAVATRWLMAHTGLYRFDTRNVFFLGHSRGSLVLWTAIHFSDDPEVKVNAAYAYQGQSTYRGEEMADAFVIPQESNQFVADFDSDYPQHELFGSAAADVKPGVPPLMLKVKEPFYRRKVPEEMFGVHHPDHALHLCEAYAAKAPRVQCTAIDNVPGGLGYEGFTDFFDRYRKP